MLCFGHFGRFNCLGACRGLSMRFRLDPKGLKKMNARSFCMEYVDIIDLQRYKRRRVAVGREERERECVNE